MFPAGFNVQLSVIILPPWCLLLLLLINRLTWKTVFKHAVFRI